MLTKSISLLVIFCLLADPCVAGIGKSIRKRVKNKLTGTSNNGSSGSSMDGGSSGSGLGMLLGGVKLTNCNTYSATAYGNKREGYTCWKRQSERDSQCRANGNFNVPGGQYSFQRTSVIKCHCCLDFLGASGGYGSSYNGAHSGYPGSPGNYHNAGANQGYAGAAGNYNSAGAYPGYTGTNGNYNNVGAYPGYTGAPGNYHNAGVNPGYAGTSGANQGYAGTFGNYNTARANPGYAGAVGNYNTAGANSGTAGTSGNYINAGARQGNAGTSGNYNNAGADDDEE